MEYETHPLVAGAGLVALASGIEFPALKRHRSRLGPLQPRHRIEQGGLPRAGSPDEKNGFAPMHVEGDSPEHVDLARPDLEGTAQIPRAEVDLGEIAVLFFCGRNEIGHTVKR